MKKQVKKNNISLRRKIAIFYARTKLILKIIIVTCLLLLFSQYFNPLKQKFFDYSYIALAKHGFKIKNVIIEGAENLTSSEIINIIKLQPDFPILKFDIAEGRKVLAENPWVRTAVVRRTLPSTIHIMILENTPVAIWQMDKKLFLIDEEGYKITDNYDGKKFSYLLHVVGKGANIYANQLVKALIKIPELREKLISAVRVSEHRWDLNFMQNITVKMPQNNFNKALEYLSALNKADKFFDQNYKILDLRDHNKYYVEYLE